MATVHLLHAGYAGDRVGSSVVLVRDGDARIVVDPGMVARRSLILDPLAALDVAPESVTHVFLSHHHPDHTINVALFPNAEVVDFWARYVADEWLDHDGDGYRLSPSRPALADARPHGRGRVAHRRGRRRGLRDDPPVVARGPLPGDRSAGRRPGGARGRPGAGPGHRRGGHPGPRRPVPGAPVTAPVTTERWVEVPGGRLFSVADGEGRPVLLVHAGIADLRAWDPMIPGLVAAGFRALRYDARAYGSSTTDDVEFSNRADLVAVLDAWDVGRAALVGNSRGGQIAFDTAIEFPDRVVAVVGVGAGLGGFDGPVSPEDMALFEEGERLESAEPRDADAIADFDVRLWVDGPGQSPDRVGRVIREAVRAMDRPLYLPGRIEGRPIVLDPPAAARLADLHCPVLAVAGTLDVSEVAEIARHLEANAPNARAVILPDVAHMIGMEAPAALSALIERFLRPLGTWS